MLAIDRRDFLHRTGGGFAGLALGALLAEEARAESAKVAPVDPLQPLVERVSHFAPKAKQVIFLFQYGGPSTFDLFDHKPELVRLHGQPVPASLKQHPDKVGGVFNHCKDELMAGPWKWSQHGECGAWVSELMPHTARHVDDLCQIRSMYSESSNHAPRDLPDEHGGHPGGETEPRLVGDVWLGVPQPESARYVLLYKVGGLGGAANWSNGFLPAAFQGTRFQHEGSPC